MRFIEAAPRGNDKLGDAAKNLQTVRRRRQDAAGKAESGGAAVTVAPEPARNSDQSPVRSGAVAWLNQAVRNSGVQLAVQVSDYVLSTFFGGDFEAFLDPSRLKSQSFRALCRRDDLELGETTLFRLVRVGHQVGRLPNDVAEALSLSHHRTLLLVTDGRHRNALARQAAQEGWSVEKLAEAVKQKQPPDPNRRGRKPLPPGLKQFAAVARGAETGLDVARFSGEFAGLAPEKQAVVRAEVLALRERVEGLVAVVT